MKTASVAIDCAILCDDSRREISNKTILIGAWPLDIGVQHFPADVMFLLHVEGAVLDSGHISPRVWVKSDDGGILFDSEHNNKIEGGIFYKGRFSVDCSTFFQVSKPTNVSFTISMGDVEHVATTRRVDLLGAFRSEREAEEKVMEAM